MSSHHSESTPASRRATHERHIVIVQYADYRGAVQRVNAGGPEVYAAQGYSLTYTQSLLQFGRVTVLALASEVHDEVLSNGVRSVGLGWTQGVNNRQLYHTLRKLGPSDVVLASPLLPVLLLAFKPGVRVLPVFADSFATTSTRRKVFFKAVSALLSLPVFSIVSNHNVPASLDLARIGVPANKVVPWDWPAQRTPVDFPAKKHPGSDRVWSVFFAGLVIEDKGVGDLIRAVKVAKQAGLEVKATIAGSGEIEALTQVAAEQGVRDRVEFLGRVPNTEIVKLMHSHDFVAVPSRHAYSEGLAMTVYEALCSRTPLLLSDHPMFERALGKQGGVRLFHANDPEALAKLIIHLAGAPTEYEAISNASADAWQHIQVPLTFGQVIDGWLRGTPEELEQLKRYSVGRYGYYDAARG